MLAVARTTNELAHADDTPTARAATTTANARTEIHLDTDKND